ncbi:hypothetical protein PLESTB_000105700 [Pleodorina starrii]|uniref:Kinesin motor domain-containing protein n=1 Tax=Pleodorina starrii TaxID=330485 RepID=A0A9W6EX27_9CHLO|nr:hypothetical protein PLESTB_000105700 [Pleodorina starrii]
MKGYNCTLFAYGQTGSGKTTTMRSVMRHAAKDIFEYIAHSRDREFVLKMCAIEVYNEVVHDLLVDVDTNLKISDDKDKGPVVVDLTEQSIESEEHLLKMLKAVEGRRQVRETKMNQKSSRSHLVVRLYVESRSAPFSAVEDDDDLMSDDSSACGEGDSMRGGDSLRSLAPVLSTINFVDLAGSERLSQASMADDTDREKIRQKEASNINVSLLTLGKVIRALGKRGEHVPYRESNLTRILQPSLSGNSRMAIVCTISPASGSVENSRAALHFANHAKAVTMRPVMNEVRGEQAIIHKMEAEILELRRKLDQSGTRQLLAEKDAQIKAREDQMRQALQERAALERRLAQMEKFIIRGGTSSPARGVRRSFDGLESLTTSIAAGGTPGPFRVGLGALAAGGSGVGVRASWTPGNPSPLEARERPSAGKGMKGFGGSIAHPNRMLLDYLLPPNVREAVNRLRADHDMMRTGPSPVAGRARHAAESAAVASAFNLRMEIGNLQGPEGPEAEEALLELQAEVGCYRSQPEVLAAVAAAASATPNNADRLLTQLTQILRNMEQREQETQAAGSQAGSGAGASGSAAPGEVAGNGSSCSSPRRQEQQQKANSEPETRVIDMVRSEIARLERLKTVNLQANEAFDSLLGKLDTMKETGVEASLQLDGLTQMPDLLERLHNALQEADALEEGDEDLAGADAAAGTADRTGVPQPDGVCTPGRRPLAADDDGEATSAPRYDSPSASAQVAAATTAATLPSPSRLTGNKLPRALLDIGEDGECVALMKSPRRGLAASPHGAAAAANAGLPGVTPNSRLQMTGGASTSIEPVQVHPPPAMQAEASQQHGADSPRPAADADDLNLRRMRTPSLSVHASDLDPMSGGRRTTSASSRGGLLRWDTERAKRIIGREKDAIHAWYANEVSRLKAAFREQAQADVDTMREAVERYRGMFEEKQERVERLNVQKQLLMKQVLNLEMQLVEAAQQEAQARSEIAALKEEVQRANESAKEAHFMARKAQAVALQHAALQNNPAENSGVVDEYDDWVKAPTSSMLLADICELWHKLHVPLSYRSRFYLHFRCKELLYLQMEQCRLRHRLEQIEKEADYLGRCKPLDKAKRALELERKVLAQGLRHSVTDAEREALYKAWDVPPDKKERKMRLVKKLWQPDYTRDEAGMETCANVVCTLSGPDATEQFMQLVFGNTAEASARPTQVGALVSTLVRRVTTPRQRKGTSTSGAIPALTASTATSQGYFANASGGAAGLAGGGVTPRRQSNLMASIAGRVGSFMGQHGPAGKPGAAYPQQGGGGTASGAATPRSVVSGPVPQLQLNVPNAPPGVAPAVGLGPMARGLANSGGYGNPVPPLPPPHPTAMMGAGVGLAAPMSSRGRATYAGGSKP